jgi:hypothetical protein
MEDLMKTKCKSWRGEIATAKNLWPIDDRTVCSLESIIREHRFSIAHGDVILLNDRWYVTHTGLLRLAVRRGCAGIRTVLQRELSDPEAGRWVFRAVVYRRRKSKGFVGYGDADPNNVSPMVRGAELRVAETRAVNRALRKAYGIGLCSVEELGTSPAPSSGQQGVSSNGSSSNGHGGSQPRLRDQLCLAIRRFKLDANLVKSYAADYCGGSAISEASRESVEAFIAHLSKTALENRDALLCKLNSYAPREEVQL